jgi:hypothetical protein
MVKLVVCFFPWLAAVLFPFFSRAQELELNQLNLFQSSGRVFIRFEISAGNTCDGIQVLRASLDGDFEEIGGFPGICGSDSVALGYTFSDDNPLINQPSRYKLAFGGFGFSKILSIEVYQIPRNGFLMTRSEAGGRTIRLDNPEGESLEWVIFGISGKEMRRGTTRGNFFPVPGTGFPAGLYRFQVFFSRSGNQVSGSFFHFP